MDTDNSSKTNQSKKAIVIGGGPGGLLASIALRKVGYSVVVYEREAVFSTGGAALNFAPNGYWCLRYLGMGDLIDKHGFSITLFSGRQYDNTFLFDYDLKKAIKEQCDGRPYLTFRRSLVHKLLLDTAVQNGVKIVMNEKFQSYSQTKGEVSVTFASGNVDTGDILVGADGLHSQIRVQIEKDYHAKSNSSDPFKATSPSYRGYTVWRGVSTGYDWPGAPRTHMIVTGPPQSTGCRLFFADMGDSKYYWFWCRLSEQGARDASPEESKKRVLKEMEENKFDISFRNIVEHTVASEIDKRDISELPPLKTWSSGRVVLLGDACHGMTPENGQGTSMAAEDAVCLAQCISSSSTIEEGINAYESTRKPRTTFVASKASFNGSLLSLQNWYLVQIRSLVLGYFGNQIMAKSLPIWSYKMRYIDEPETTTVTESV